MTPNRKYEEAANFSAAAGHMKIRVKAEYWGPSTFHRWQSANVAALTGPTV
jgi:hypothetical protein